MKRIIIILFLFSTMTAAAQETENINLGLIPTPQKVEYGKYKGKTANYFTTKIVRQKVDTLPAEANLDQAYQMII